MTEVVVDFASNDHANLYCYVTQLYANACWTASSGQIISYEKLEGTQWKANDIGMVNRHTTDPTGIDKVTVDTLISTKEPSYVLEPGSGPKWNSTTYKGKYLGV
jgi:hypothetical protein